MNIYDIAKLANVSIATVSRVVNNSPKVSLKTKEKVLAVMKENEYTPNAFARGLGLGSMKTVGIICPNIDDIYMAKAVSYLEQNLHAHGYDCILGCSGHTREAKENYVKLLLSKRIDALVMVGSTYGGNPMAGQACRTVFKILEETKMLDHVQDISEYLIEKLDDLKDKYSCIKERRGLGLMIGLEFDRPVKDIVQTCLDNGLIVVMAGANVIRMLPPFITTEKDVDQAIAILDQAIEKNI